MTVVGEIDRFEDLSPLLLLFDVQSGQDIVGNSRPHYIGFCLAVRVLHICCYSMVCCSF